MIAGKCARCGGPGRGLYSELPHSTECERCGDPVCQPLGSGRRRRWCGDACRRRAWEERQAAERGAIAVKRVRVEPSLAEATALVAESPAAVRKLLQALRQKAERGEIKRWGAWQNTIEEARELSWAFDRLPL